MPLTRGAAIDYLDKRFGGPTEDRPTSLTVGTSEVVVLGHDTERVVAIFVNVGATTIYINPGPGTASNFGIRLGPNGGLAGFTVEEDATLPCQEWRAIGDLAAGTLYTLVVKRTSQYRGESAT